MNIIQPIRKQLKLIVVFFTINFLTSLVAPYGAYALTSGPTAPEATSFEPIDTTDMVNPLTGDFTYNMPLLEVPGPSGGYPLSLSYHAGIMPNEEASWVGLGWTLNPGAINRSVNGFADDHHDVPNTDRTFWEGGERKSGSLGVSIGVPGTPSISVGIEVGHDTYQGFGVGGYVGIGITLVGAGDASLGISATVGVDPWGNAYGSAGLNVGVGKTEKGALNLGVGAGVSTNFETVGGYASGSVSMSQGKGPNGKHKNNIALTGASISTGGGLKASLSVGGGSTRINNGKSGNISTSSSGANLPIPTPIPGLFVNLGYKYQRYWMDEISEVATSGALYYPDEAIDDWRYFNENAYDTYSLLDPSLEGGIMDNPDPTQVMGGSFPNVDNYSVNAQGISGSFKPHFFKKHLARQVEQHVDGEGDTHQDLIPHTMGHENMPVEFRFINDFSNRYQYDPETGFEKGSPTLLDFEFDGVAFTGESESDGILNNHLAGSKHIKFLTNKEIVNKNNKLKEVGFIETNASGLVRAHNDQIGAYVMTNESGVKYHFALPAYAGEEFQYSENIAKGTGHTFNQLRKPEKYAYTWYLTAITGPDYVDRGIAGELDEADWGYWVEFDYGKWTDQYAWRSPEKGMEQDLDNNFQNFVEGVKEVYYLDAVKTKTHTALFVKDIREDAKSALKMFKNTDFYLWPLDLKKKYGVGNNGLLTQGGFIPKEFTYEVAVDIFPNVQVTQMSKPVSSLKLEKVILIENDKVYNKTIGNQLHQSIFYDDKLYKEVNVVTSTEVAQHLPDNVLDKYDIEQTLIDNALRVIELDTDYSLAPETMNSFSSSGLLGNGDPSIAASSYPLNGKLTLNAVNFLGKGGAELIPPTNFEYELENELIENLNILSVDYYGALFFEGYSQALLDGLDKGDLVKFKQNGKWYNGYFIQSYVSEDGDWFKIGINSDYYPTEGGVVDFQKTKNPKFDNEAVDIWGTYKSDFKDGNYDIFEDLGGETTEISAKNTDVWSLRKIESSLGSDIQIVYEPKKHQTAVYGKAPFYIKGIKPLEANQVHITLNTELSEEVFAKVANLETVDLSLVLRHKGKAKNAILGCHNNGKAVKDFYKWYPFNGEVNVISINKGKIVVENAELFTLATQETEGDFEWCECPEEWSDGIGQGLYNFESTPWPMGGHVYFGDLDLAKYGGGIATQSIAIKSLMGDTRKTSYKYNGGVTAYTPINFVNFPHINLLTSADESFQHFETFQNEALKAYSKPSNAFFSELLANSREIPAPGVMYESVTIEESVIHENGSEEFLPSYSTYEFEVFDKGMVNIERTAGYEDLSDVLKDYYGDGPQVVKYHGISHREVTLRDYTTQVGNLKSITLYDRATGAKISETINGYLHSSSEVMSNDIPNEEAALEDRFERNHKLYEPLLNTTYASQGVIEETFAEANFIRYKEGDRKHKRDLLGVITKRETFPAIQTSQTNTNYKTGISTTTQSLAFDFYSGQAVKTLTTDVNGYGDKYVTEITPAYKQYPEMGLAIYEGNKNMLTQTAATTTYKVNNAFEDAQTDNNKIGLVGSTVQTWTGDGTGVLGASAKDQEGIFRKKATYSWIGNNQELQEDGHYPYEDFVAFDAWNGGDPTSDQWQKNGEITLYDPYSHALEAIDINGNYAATRMDANQEKVIATVANAPYEAFTYSGFENVFDGKVSEVPAVDPKGQVSPEYAHTGAQSFRLKPGGTARYITSISQAFENKPYVISYWTKVTGAQPDPYYSVDNEPDQLLKNGFDESKSVEIDGNTWYLHEAIFTPPSDFNTIRIGVKATNDTWVDDFRFHPLDAAMVSYVYNEWGELSHVLDANNLFTEYRYDAMGRLQETYIESFQYGVKRVSEYDYKYALLCEEPVEDPFSAEMINHGTEEDPDLEVLVSGGQAPYTYTWYVYTPNFLDPNLGNPEFAETTNYFNSLFDVDPICSAFTVKCKVTEANNEAINVIEDFNEGGLKFDSPLAASFQKGVGEDDHELTVKANALNGVPPYDITATVFIAKVEEAQNTQEIEEGEQYQWVSYYNNESEYEEFSVSVSITDQQNCQISTRVIIITDSEPGPPNPECPEQGTEVAFVCEKCQDVPEFNTGYAIPVLADGDCGTYQDPLLRYKDTNACPPNPDPDFICQIPDSE